ELRQKIGDPRPVADVLLGPGAPLARVGIPHLRTGRRRREIAVSPLTEELGFARTVVKYEALGGGSKTLLDQALGEEYFLAFVVEGLDSAAGVAEQLERLLRSHPIAGSLQDLKGGIYQDPLLV